MIYRRSSNRQGVILLVVISLLMLFAVAGIAFVIYSEAQATTARIWRESESFRRPDMDPEELLAYFMGQLIYGTDNPQSALRGHDHGFELAMAGSHEASQRRHYFSSPEHTSPQPAHQEWTGQIEP